MRTRTPIAALDGAASIAIPHLLSETPAGPGALDRLPDELLLEIGEHLLRLPESSSLRAVVQVSRRLRGVLSQVRNQSIQRFGRQRALFAQELRKAMLADKSCLDCVFSSLRDHAPESRSYFLHDAIDHIAGFQYGDHKKGEALAALSQGLKDWVSTTELLPIAERLRKCHLSLSIQAQGPSLVAIAGLIKALPLEASEWWIGGITHTLSRNEQELSPAVREAIICELAELTDRVGDDKKSIHILNILSFIGGLPADRRAHCRSHLKAQMNPTTIAGVGGAFMTHIGQQLKSKALSFFGFGGQG